MSMQFFQYNQWSRNFDYYTAPVQMTEMKMIVPPHLRQQTSIPWQAIEVNRPVFAQHSGTGDIPKGFAITGQEQMQPAQEIKCADPVTDIVWGAAAFVAGQLFYAGISRYFS